MRPLAACCCVLLVAAAIPASAQAPPIGHGSALERLTRPFDAGAAHYSSYDRTGGNDDWVAIAPGETPTLMEHDGAGVVRRLWVTVSPRNDRELQRQMIVRAYWDGEAQPSVEVPLSDFFGMGFGEWKDFTSLPLNMTSGGYNSYWPMPFRTGARITITNTARRAAERFYYNIDVLTYDRLPDDVLYFHAQYRQHLTQAGSPVAVLEARGRGHYVGTLASMQPLQGSHLGYLEGDERIYIDGERQPSYIGTGTEDYFSSGWYYDTGEYSAPYHGVTIKDEEKGRINTYRWHIEDPIPFRQSFRFDLEHGGTNDQPGVEYATVAFWYQTEPHASFVSLPRDLLPLSRLATPEIEAEALLSSASVTGGELQVQQMGAFDSGWGGEAQLWWVGARPGNRLSLQLPVPAAGTYELVGFFTRANDYGIFQLRVNDEPLQPLVDGFSRTVEPTGPISFGNVRLAAGTATVVVELLGKDARSSGYSDGYLVGIDGFVLRRAE
ncbi:MAG TPA: glycoside hydrolase family 172 protein [Longimicrobiales bacterium]|nr:glycoside hydrolase family 172 protein [Longimicrobiales bacterium]